MVVLAKTQIIVDMRPAIAVERKIERHHIAFFRAIILDCLIERSANEAGCGYTATFDRDAAKNCGMRLIG
ncbi:hypothetical protein [Candidatus Nitrotoga sp. 1052]|uniref:hypothetical protein n=1 Tax=Candidatus Nitrotoga sp. 1052 TaxID=2886964 RepID=UPI001EF587CA|nr:hypothetical protein [Candidatus Nitrotoga sp. 1052]